jgi:hypothetical protein
MDIKRLRFLAGMPLNETEAKIKDPTVEKNFGDVKMRHESDFKKLAREYGGKASINIDGDRATGVVVFKESTLDESNEKLAKFSTAWKNLKEGIETVTEAKDTMYMLYTGVKGSGKLHPQHSDDSVAACKQEFKDSWTNEHDKDGKLIKYSHKVVKVAKGEQPPVSLAESVEDISDDSLDEGSTMSAAQKARREEIVKAMKDKTPEFKKKYGADWRNVMYATATKQAMSESVEVVDEGRDYRDSVRRAANTDHMDMQRELDNALDHPDDADDDSMRFAGDHRDSDESDWQESGGSCYDYDDQDFDSISPISTDKIAEYLGVPEERIAQLVAAGVLTLSADGSGYTINMPEDGSLDSVGSVDPVREGFDNVKSVVAEYKALKDQGNLKDAAEAFKSLSHLVGSDAKARALIAGKVEESDNNNFFQPAEDAKNTVNDRMGVKQERGTKIAVPAEIKKAVSGRIAELKAAMVQYDEKGYNDHSQKEKAIECMEQIMKDLSSNDVEGLKQAQIFYGTLMSPITDLFPSSLLLFLANAKIVETYGVLNWLDKLKQ